MSDQDKDTDDQEHVGGPLLISGITVMADPSKLALMDLPDPA
ncbi:hypothetical protein [Streptomyces anulatus]